MQDDSTPSKERKKGKNERYTASSQPKLLSLSSAKRKATKFAAKNDKSLRVGAKRAILRELNSHLVVKAQGILPPQNTSNPYGVGQPVSQPNPTGSRAQKLVDKKQSAKHKEVYTWNKNGRQEELKIRYVARKYVLLWIRKVYGKLHPHVAREHYQYHLKLKVLKVWQDIWWSGRKGWKLNIRAEYHDRYRTWVRVWRSWRAFTLRSRAKKDKLQRSLLHLTTRTQRKYLKAWKEYVEYRRVKKEKLVKTHNVAILSCKRWAWLQWMSQIERKRNQTKMEHTALKYWALNLLAKSWMCWILSYNECRVEKKKMVAAKTHSHKFLLVRVWKHWQIYHSYKKLKALKARFADQHYKVTSATRTLKTWKARWERSRQLAQFDHLIIYKGNLARARKLFNHWKFYLTLQHKRQADEAKAIDHYLRSLKKRCLHALCYHRIIQHQKYSSQNTAQTFWYKLQLKRVWTIWLKQCENSEELKIYPLTRRARLFNRLKLLNKSIHGWQLYWKWRKHRRILYSIADTHFNNVLLPRCLRRMQCFVEIMKEKRENRMEADLFRREVLLTQTFYKWQHEYQLTLDVKMMNRMAILHHDQTIKIHYLTVWKHKTTEELRQHELQDQADYHWEQHLLIKAITDWKNFVRRLKISRYYQQTAFNHHYLTILRKIWSAWSKYVDQKSVKWRKQAIADLHYQHRVLSKLLNAWKVYHSCTQRALVASNQKFNGYETQRIRWAWLVWRHFVGWHRNKCILYQRAKAAYRKTILKKVLLSWHIYACQHALKIEEQAIACREKRVFLNEGKLKRSFYAWVWITKVSLHKKSLYQQSDQHFKRILCHKALTAWRQFIQLTFRKKLLRRQSQWLHNQRIMVYFFRLWKHQYSKSIETRKKTSLSLWHWSVTVQRKAFHIWLQYAIFRKQKQIRIAQALDQRRTRLIKAGVTQWIEVAFELISVRNRYAQARNVQQAHDIHQFVYKCATHWRKWTARRIAEKVHKREIPATIKYKTSSTRQEKNPVQFIRPKEPLPDLFKARPKPRVPDYLRASFDVTSLDEDKEPLAPCMYNIVPNLHQGAGVLVEAPFPRPIPISSVSNRVFGESCVPQDGEETPCHRPPPISSVSNRMSGESRIPKNKEETPCPRPPPPPRTELMPHPSQRSFTNDSMALLLSSDGEADAQPTPKLKHMQSKPKLLPPSSFELSTRRQEDSKTSTLQDVPKDTPSLSTNEDVKRQIFEARKKLQEYYSIKLRYREVKQQRDQLINSIEHDPNFTQDLNSRQLTNLNEELVDLMAKIERDKEDVQQVAVDIQQLIQRVTTG